MGRLEGKIALITGSSRGIGAEIARLFAAESAAVALHGRDAAALESVRREIGKAGGNAITVRADVTNFGEIEKARREIESLLGPVDLLVANAGASLTPPAPLEDIPEDGWRASVEANLSRRLS